MAGEADQVVEQELTPEENAAADAAFEAAFNSTRGDSPHAEGSTLENDANGKPLITGAQAEQEGNDETAQAAAAADAEAQAAADAEAAAQAEANAPVPISKTELAALQAAVALIPQLQDELRRSNDKVAGRFGSLQQTIEAVRTQAQQGIKPTLKQLTRLEKEFPELAGLLKDDLEEAFGAGNATQGGAAGTDDPTQGDNQASGAAAPGAEAAADPFADPRVQQTLRDKEMAIVDAVHPDWRPLTQTPEFNEWRASLPAPAQQLLGSSWDSNVMIPAFKDFKDWKAKRVAAETANKERGKRLARGIPATTGAPTGANAVDEDAAFLSGFTQVRGNRGR